MKLSGPKVCLFALALTLSTFALLSGCAAPNPLTRIVHVEHTSYLPIPPELLAPCPAADLSKIATNGGVLRALLADSAALANCNAQLRAIRSLKPPVPGT